MARHLEMMNRALRTWAGTAGPVITKCEAAPRDTVTRLAVQSLQDNKNADFAVDLVAMHAAPFT
jgi:hypothetical protein